MPILAVPDPNLVRRSSGEDIGEPIWEGNIVDPFIVAGIPQFWVEVGGVDPVNIGLRSSTEEVGVISSEGNRSHIAHDFTLVE